MALCEIDLDTTSDLCFLMVMGLSGAGKTSICKILRDHLRLHGFRAVHLCFDDFLENEKIDFNNSESTWKEQRAGLLTCVENVVHCVWKACSNETKLDAPPIDLELCSLRDKITELFQEALNSSLTDTRLKNASSDRGGPPQLVIILDDNFYYNSMRHAIHLLARHLRAGCATLFLNVTLSRALLVNCLRESRVVPDNVIRRMAERLEKPPAGAWEIHCMEIKEAELGFIEAVGQCTDNNKAVSRIESMLRRALRSPVLAAKHAQLAEEEEARLAAAQEVCSLSSLHQADLVLRQLVAAQVSAADHGAGQRFVQDKKRYLVALRNGNVCIPAALNQLRNAAQNAQFACFIEESFQCYCAKK